MQYAGRTYTEKKKKAKVCGIKLLTFRDLYTHQGRPYSFQADLISCDSPINMVQYMAYVY
jgi:hypothetical protein